MSGHSDIAEPQVNVTPLIDVMLVLLVILIITLPVATHAVKLNLPQGDSALPPESVRVDIYSAGEMYWNDEHVDSIAQLMPRFEALARWQIRPSSRWCPTSARRMNGLPRYWRQRSARACRP